MGCKNWIKPLDGGFYLIVRLTTFLGKIVDFAVVLIYDGADIARYDTAHGYPHLDMIGRKNGLIKKVECERLVLEEAFHYAIDDFSKNAGFYLESFERN